MNPEWLAFLGRTNKDPEAFVHGAFPWGEPGPLERYTGPESWQTGILRDIRDGLLTPNQAIRLATASGHGVGKSACVGWIILWAFLTAADTRGVITANTEVQLKSKTWAELGKWFNLLPTELREAFQLNATSLLSRDPTRERTWRIDMIPWSERNTEAFAGMHNKGRRILLIFDEASAIDDKIWEVSEGALTDTETEILWIVFGNPTRNTGRFRDCFGSQKHLWRTRQVDSRSVSITNKELFAQWIETYGEDSDFVRVRVLGEFPRTGEMEFISAADIDAAMAREVTSSIIDPLALGCDVARYGANESVIAYRKGRDARTIPWGFYRGLSTVSLATKVHQAHETYKPDGIFIDGGGVGGGVVDNVRAQYLYCFDVQFGGKDDVGGMAYGAQGERYGNKRAAMWGAMRAWLKVGAIPNDPDLRAQLLGPTYSLNVRGEIVLESKEEMMRRGVASPDRADALALTFAYPLQANPFAGGLHSKPNVVHEYNPFDNEHMAA